MNSEKIMVCVYYGPNGERLIRRGIHLSQLIQSPLCVLSVIDQPLDEMDQQQENYVALWRKLTEEAGGHFVLLESNGQEAADIITSTAQQHDITQLIIGQSAQTRWQEIIKGSIVNDLLEKLGAIDLHIVAVQRMQAHLEETHEQGVDVDVIQTSRGYEIAYETHGRPIITEGIFFKDMHTDFDNGLLKLCIDGQYQYLKVFKGKLIDELVLEPHSV
ncbi:universal stress protein [Paenibacillus sp. PsM32]|uniref:Universal stress protein n=1 Tax=Paenibacillus kyungheensis TaxID=1452732 RepID=A0AAX3M323_9BACL|nr:MULTISPECIES: universal stress protein [Paenibacillus]MDN4618643.1 universal stress protein [Paenibacillus sp. PsM32]MDQ1236333.1 two-component system sensor histidine kinase KdpD [Paenibacillus sp. SORGH_AS_0306]MDR6108687.1 two-component system sensor histidine kinase KdpD [Paenibacillus sp. SORGH_AS_0338]WCT55768.1 universal stress protein [Paenibacillus kyungheensis]WDF51067.1 universal stress protein [Paenibacillus sp. KACC 21273]